MTDQQKARPRPDTAAFAEARKAERLRREAEALRANLRKRKEQERARKPASKNSV